MKTRSRMTNQQQLLVIEWIKHGKTEAEVNALAQAEQPPFSVSPRKYKRYWLNYSPQHLAGILVQMEQQRAKTKALVEQFYAQESQPPAQVKAQLPEAPAEKARTIGDWAWEMLFGENKGEEKFTPLTMVRDAFKPWG